MASWVEAKAGIKEFATRGEIYLAQITPDANPQIKLEGLVVASNWRALELQIPLSSGEVRYTSEDLRDLRIRLASSHGSNRYFGIKGVMAHNNLRAVDADLANPDISVYDQLLPTTGNGMEKFDQRYTWGIGSKDGSPASYTRHFLTCGRGWEGLFLTIDGSNPQDVENCIESFHANVAALRVEPLNYQSWRREAMIAVGAYPLKEGFCIPI